MTNPAPQIPASETPTDGTPQHLLPLNYNGTETRAVVYGKTCPICGGPLFVPRRGLPPKTCSARCRQKLSRNQRSAAAAKRE